MHPLGTFEKVQPSDSFCTLFSYFFPKKHMHSQKKRYCTKAVTGAVPFQKGKLLSMLGTNMYILGANMYILGANMYH